MDSTGAAAIKRHEVSGKPQVQIAKELGNPFELLGIVRKKPSSDFSDIISGTQRAMLGHCRSSTRGSTSRKNAHPFLVDNIIGTHNGTLTYQTEKELGDYSRFETDSEKVFAAINDQGIQEVSKLFNNYSKTMNDAYALVWYDLKDNTINFLRNKERPLHYAFDKNNEMLFWSSEACHLAAGMSEIQHEEKFLYTLPEDYQYSWEIPEVNKKFGKPKVSKREGRKTSPFSNPGYHSPMSNNSGLSFSDTDRDDYESMGYYYTEQKKYTNPPSNETDWDCTWDKNNFLWSRWSSVTNAFKWARHSSGPYYDTQQDLWDALEFGLKVDRALRNEVPMAVKVSSLVMEEVAHRRKITSKPVEEVAEILERKEPVDFNSARERLKEKHKESRLKLTMGESPRGTEIYRDTDRRVYWDSKEKYYSTWSYVGLAQNPPWIETQSKTCPEFVPFTQLDVNARHQFKHSGKKKKKVTYFRGFQSGQGTGDMLVRTSFERLMEAGCVNCQRKPQWGNDVQFISHVDFFCEFCKKDSDMVKSFQMLAKG